MLATSPIPLPHHPFSFLNLKLNVPQLKASSQGLPSKETQHIPEVEASIFLPLPLFLFPLIITFIIIAIIYRNYHTAPTGTHYLKSLHLQDKYQYPHFGNKEISVQ